MSDTTHKTPAASRRWTPILGDGLQTQALEATRDIAQALRQSSNTPRADDAASPASLASGEAGLAVLYTCLAEADMLPEAEEHALGFLDAAMEALAAAPSGPSLFAGFTGVGWTAAHLEGRLFDCDDSDPNEVVDEALHELLSRSPWRGEYDVVSGLVGFGVYALERLPRPSAIEQLDRVLVLLDEMAERTAMGVTWRTAPELLPAQQRKDCPDGCYNLGLAHGVPGVIAFLGQVCAREGTDLRGARQKARVLLDGAVEWMLGQQPADHAQSFPYWVGPGLTPAPARLAWCYGDLGIAVALLQAARGARELTWERAALRIAHRAAARPAEQSGVVDCGLCHGAAGAGHLFNRLFQATGDETLGNAARSWLARTLEMRQADKGIAGFPAWRPDPNRSEEKHWTAEPGILEGAGGVALALLAAVTDIEPEWDRMLLASIDAPVATHSHIHQRPRKRDTPTS